MSNRGKIYDTLRKVEEASKPVFENYRERFEQAAKQINDLIFRVLEKAEKCPSSENIEDEWIVPNEWVNGNDLYWLISCYVSRLNESLPRQGRFKLTVHMELLACSKVIAEITGLEEPSFVRERLGAFLNHVGNGSPTCKHDFSLLRCDNDCGTKICKKCDAEIYCVNGMCSQGHNPKCGEDSEPETIEDGTTIQTLG